jgi:hypothetical protein
MHMQALIVMFMGRYCLNRDAEKFACVRFFIDRLHDKNHKTCSKAHFIAFYKDLERLNSQVVE